MGRLRGNSSVCYTNGYVCASGAPNTGWLYDNSNFQWALSPNASLSYRAFTLKSDGHIDRNSDVKLSYNTRPCVYLRPDTEILSGDGSSGNPYRLEDVANKIEGLKNYE